VQTTTGHDRRSDEAKQKVAILLQHSPAKNDLLLHASAEIPKPSLATSARYAGTKA
jgi:hypothetical protein